MKDLITYRLATHSDTGRLKDLITVSARGLSVGYYTHQQIESAIAHIFGVDSQLIEDQTYFIAESSGTFVGCGGWSKRKTLFGGDQFKKADPDLLIDPLYEPARIRAFFIHPDWKRRGIGSGILTACTMVALKEGYKKLELGSTLPGVPFYSKLGFKEMEKLSVHLPDGVDLPLVKMSKDIARAM